MFRRECMKEDKKKILTAAAFLIAAGLVFGIVIRLYIVSGSNCSSSPNIFVIYSSDPYVIAHIKAAAVCRKDYFIADG